MKIVEHGSWSYYEPPEGQRKGLPPEVIFSKRDKDGVDWYEYRKRFDGKSVVAVVTKRDEGWVVGAANRDASKVFPHGDFVLEITGHGGVDPQKDFGGKIYDPASKTLKDAPEPERLTLDLTAMQQAIKDLQAQLAKLTK